MRPQAGIAAVCGNFMNTTGRFKQLVSGVELNVKGQTRNHAVPRTLP
jgi:hypothetical protein